MGLPFKPAQRWQDSYADPEWRFKLTVLSPTEETQFKAWAKKNNAPITEDYDMRGFWKYGGDSSISKYDGKMHFTDAYKTPLHDSFSGESRYARRDILTPQWNDKGQLVSPSGDILVDESISVK